MIEWIELSIQQDGDLFVGYESLSDKRFEGTWEQVAQWAENLMDEVGEEAA